MPKYTAGSEIINQISSINDLSSLNGTELSQFLNLLIKNEDSPGGPYFTSALKPKDSLKINRKILSLFKDAGKALPATSSYLRSLEPLQTNRPKTSDHQTEAITNLSNHNPKLKLDDKIYLKLMNEVKSSSINTETKNQIINTLNKIKLTDKNGEISSLSTMFCSSMKDDLANSGLADSSKNINVEGLNTANVFAWSAYSIFDAIIDADSNITAAALPMANVFQRKSIEYYIQSGVKYGDLNDYFNIVDSATNKEVKYRSLIKHIDNTVNISTSVNIEKLHSLMWKKSFLHILGPMSITKLIAPNHYNSIARALKLYCQARQLNDDLHDWLEDFSKSSYTYVIASILNDAKITNGKYNIDDIIQKMKESFWEKSLIKLCNEQVKIVNESIEILESTILKKDAPFITTCLIPIKNSANRALRQHEFNVDFVNSYKIYKAKERP